MNYTKPALTIEQQVGLLQSRGLSGDPALLAERLAVVSYYRLSAYWHPFRRRAAGNPGELLDEFVSGSTFDAVWERYAFDRRLRLLVMDAVERIEVAVRSALANHHALKYGTFAYAVDRASLPGICGNRYGEFLASFGKELGRSKEQFVADFTRTYGDCHGYPPVWMAVEIMTLGSVLSFFRGCSPEVRRLVAEPFGVHDKVFESWLLMLNTVRNICAHHGRLWNREIGTKPKIPEKIEHWRTPVRIANDRVFGTLTICKWSLDRIAPQSRWADRVRSLLDEYPRIPRRSMGFPSNWTESPIWSKPNSAAGCSP